MPAVKQRSPSRWTGHYKPEQVFLLKQAVELYDFYDQQLQRCDAELEALYRQFDPPKIQAHRRLPPHSQAAQEPGLLRPGSSPVPHGGGVDLIQIDGVDELTILKVLSETGTDISPWPTEKHFTSWLRLCPNNKITGGKDRAAWGPADQKPGQYRLARGGFQPEKQ